MPLRLNLGCGDLLLPYEKGWVNVDAKWPDPEKVNGHAVLVHDLREPLPFKAQAADEILAKHVAEHFTPAEWGHVLYDWVRVLKPGGRIVIECPDLQRCCEAYANNKLDCQAYWYQTIYGQEGEGMRHYQGLSIPKLREQMMTAGLKIAGARYLHDGVNEWLKYNLQVIGVRP